MNLGKGCVDLVLVPPGVLLMLGYHLYLLYRILRRPERTTIGYENHYKRAWVSRMLRGGMEEARLALSVISSNISASNTLASLSIALGSLIGAWVGSSTSHVFFTKAVIYGDTGAATTSVKYISLLVCFLVAFTSFIQSARHYVHASFLITTLDSDVPISYVQTAVIRGGNFWTVGLRALYLATTLMLWFFGPIPMLVCSVVMVSVLHVLDSNSTEPHHFRFDGLRNKAQRVMEKDTGSRHWLTPSPGLLAP